MRKSLLLLGALLASATALHAETQLIGCMYGSSAGNKSGIYKISTTSPTITMLSDKPQATGGGVLAGDTYYCQWYLSIMGSEVWSNMASDTETWEMQGAVGARDTWAFDLAYDDSTDRIYGCFHDPDENYEGQRLVFGWIKPQDYITDYATVNPVCDVFVNYAGMDFDSTGQLWAISREGLLLKIDKETGATTLVASTGLVSDYNTTAAIDRATDTMYYFLQLKAGSGATVDQTSLYTISLADGTATKVYDLPGAEAVQGLGIFVPLAEDKAPAAPADLALSFTDAALNGSISFSVPANTYDGATAAGNVDYKVAYRPYEDEMAEYRQLATGITTFGTRVDVPVTLPGNGWYSFSVTLGNATGDSPRTLIDKYVGYDTPLSPSEVTATVDGENVTVSWTAPTKTLHNGYLDAEALTYKVVRMPDEVTVGENLTASTLTTPAPTPSERTHYTYNVYADNHGMTSAHSASNTLAIGAYAVPFQCDFLTEDEFSDFTVLRKVAYPDFIYTWEYNIGAKGAKLSNTIRDDDDWLITPGLALEAGHTYELTLEIGNNDANNPGKFEVSCGTEPTREGMAQHTLMAETGVTAKRPAFETFTVTFTPETSGTYHFGVHGVTPARSWDDLFLYSIGVKDNTETSVNGIILDTETEYYSIDGRRLSEAQAHGLVIVRRAGKVYKIIRP